MGLVGELRPPDTLSEVPACLWQALLLCPTALHICSSMAAPVSHLLPAHTAPPPPHLQASDVLAQQGKRGESLLPLTRLFHPGQLVRCVVTGLRTGAAAEPEPRAPAGQKRKRGAPQKLIELSLEVARVCSGVAADEGLREGMALPACVRSVEDHGYTLLLGPQGAEGESASLPSVMLSLHCSHSSSPYWPFGAEGACSSGSGARILVCWMAAHPLASRMLGASGLHVCSVHPLPYLCLERDVERFGAPCFGAPWHQGLPKNDLQSEGMTPGSALLCQAARSVIWRSSLTMAHEVGEVACSLAPVGGP